MARRIGANDRILLCTEWSLHAVKNFPGVEVDHCFYCGASLITSPEGRLLMSQDKDVHPTCTRCVVSDPRSMGAKPFITPEIREAVKRMTGCTPEEIYGDMTVGEAAKTMKWDGERKMS